MSIQHKKNEQTAMLKYIGAESDEGTDYYVSAKKLHLNESVLVDAIVRFTKANQTGILSLGGDRNDLMQTLATSS